MGLELDLTQLAFPFNGVFQPAKRNDTAIQFAPFGDSPLHLKALGVTVCGLALVGEWYAMGSFDKHRMAGSLICEGCKS